MVVRARPSPVAPTALPGLQVLKRPLTCPFRLMPCLRVRRSGRGWHVSARYRSGAPTVPLREVEISAEVPRRAMHLQLRENASPERAGATFVLGGAE
jgi:hypothetical protein